MLARRSCQTEGVSPRRERLVQARLYLVCGEQPDAFLHAALSGGVDVVQLRMKDAQDGALVRVARRYAAICAEHGALFILNDRPDLVPTVGADGAHVGQDDLAVPAARRLIGEKRLLGLSTHSPAQVDAAGGAGVDYIGVGPVHATPTKPGRSAVGLELVRYAAAHTAVPFFAIGGITAANAAVVRGAGAARVAVVRALTEAADACAAAQELRDAVTREEYARAGA
jgi:thiamine-phosphate pyrophosphorylase